VRTHLLHLICIASLMATGLAPAMAAESCPSLLRHTVNTLQDNAPMPLCQHAGKVVLVVNTASYCGFTSQSERLEKFYASLKDKGLVVIGFPSNDFGDQEPGSNNEIADFCRLTYGIQFPMAAKTTLKGKDTHPFFAQLAAATGSTPRWNFHKYLINRDATQVVAFGSMTRPDDKALLQKINEFLK